MDKIDPYKHKEKYLKWRSRFDEEISDISPTNRELFNKYLLDMESGLNVSTFHKRGSRSYLRLNTIRTRILYLIRMFEFKLNLMDITKINEEQIHAHFLAMRNGGIRKKNGKTFNSVKDFVQDFKAFWHWWQRVNKKKGIEILDITVDLDTSGEKPKWVYLTEEEVRKLIDNAIYDYKALILFLFDSGVRAPTELINIRVSDFYNDYKELQIRNETSKTFGRRIKLMLCPDVIKKYVSSKNLKKEDYIFDICPSVTNKYFKRLALKVLGDGVSPAGEKYLNLTMYDLRHCSCCYWLPRYKSESALKYRFGWKESDKIHYYSELLGMSDTISQEDLLVDLTKTELEQKYQKSEKEKEIMQETLKAMGIQVAKIMERTIKLEQEAKHE